MPVTMTAEQQKRSRARARAWKQFREAHLYSQRALAERLGCSRRTIVAIERCELISPSFKTLRAFRDLLLKEERAGRVA